MLPCALGPEAQESPGSQELKHPTSAILHPKSCAPPFVRQRYRPQEYRRMRSPPKMTLSVKSSQFATSFLQCHHLHNRQWCSLLYGPCTLHEFHSQSVNPSASKDCQIPPLRPMTPLVNLNASRKERPAEGEVRSSSNKCFKYVKTTCSFTGKNCKSIPAAVIHKSVHAIESLAQRACSLS